MFSNPKKNFCTFRGCSTFYTNRVNYELSCFTKVDIDSGSLSIALCYLVMKEQRLQLPVLTRFDYAGVNHRW